MSLKIAIPVFAMVLVGVTTTTQVMSEDEAAALAPLNSVRLADPANVIVTRSEDVVRSYKIGASIIPARRVTLTAQISGRVRSIAGRAGDPAIANQLLVGINPDQLLAQRRAAIAALWQAESQVRNAQMQYQRQLYLAKNGESRRGGGGLMPFGMDRMMNRFAGGGPSRMQRGAEVFDSRTSISKAQTAVMAARSKIDGLDAKLANSESRAPFNGVIFKRLVEQGDTVQRGQPLLVLADLSRMQVDVDVPAKLAQSLRTSSPIEVLLDGSEQPVMATVAQVFPMADKVRHTVRVKIDLPQDIAAAVGMYAQVSIPDIRAGSAIEQFPVIPHSAITYRGHLPMVYVLGEDDGPSLRLVRLGEKTDSGIAVTSGLHSGDRVVVDSVRYTAGL